MADRERPGFEFHGYITMPKGTRTTSAKAHDVANVLELGLREARDKVGGDEAGMRVDRNYIVNGARHVMRGPKRVLDEWD